MVPRLWSGATVVCLGTGPSLCAEDLTLVEHSTAKAIAVNDACLAAPWAPVIFSADVLWWRRQPQAVASFALKFMLPPLGDGAPPGVNVLLKTGQSGIETDPKGLRSGGHSGYAAVNLAALLGGTKIILLGYDMQPTLDGRHHFFGEHPDRSHPRYAQWLDMYAALPTALWPLGITIVNASRETAITAIPRQPLAEALCSP